MPVSGVDRKPERPRRERVVADQRYRRIREGPTLGGAPISIAVNFGFPLTGAGVAILYAAFFSGGALLWALGIVCVTAGVVSFASGKTLQSMPEEPSKRRRSASEGFRPIKQVGVANSIGFPLMMIGILILFIANSAGGTGIWVLGGVLVALGLVASLSGKVIQIDSGPDPEERAKRKPRIRAGPDLGSRQVGVGISVGFPVLTVGFALLVSAYLTGGALFWILGTVLFVLGLMAFTSGKTFQPHPK